MDGRVVEELPCAFVSPNLLEVHVKFHPTFSKLHHLFAKEIFKITRAYFFYVYVPYIYMEVAQIKITRDPQLF